MLNPYPLKGLTNITQPVKSSRKWENLKNCLDINLEINHSLFKHFATQLKLKSIKMIKCKKEMIITATSRFLIMEIIFKNKKWTHWISIN